MKIIILIIITLLTIILLTYLLYIKNIDNNTKWNLSKSENKEIGLKVEDPFLNDKLSDFAQTAFFALGARDYGRIDIRLDKNDEPMFLEANLLPSLIENYGNFPKACHLYKNMDHEDMILTLVNLGLSHKKSKLISPAVEIKINNKEVILV